MRLSLTLEVAILLAMLVRCSMRMLFWGCGLNSRYTDFLQFSRNSLLLTKGSSLSLNYTPFLQSTSTFSPSPFFLNFSPISSSSPILPRSMLFKLSQIFKANSTLSLSILRISLTPSLASSSSASMVPKRVFISLLLAPKNLKPFSLCFCMYFSLSSSPSSSVDISSMRQKVSYFMDSISRCFYLTDATFCEMRDSRESSSFCANSRTCFWLAMKESLQASREYRQLCSFYCIAAYISCISVCSSSFTLRNTPAQTDNSLWTLPSSARQDRMPFFLASNSPASSASSLAQLLMPAIFLAQSSPRCWKTFSRTKLLYFWNCYIIRYYYDSPAGVFEGLQRGGSVTDYLNLMNRNHYDPIEACRKKVKRVQRLVEELEEAQQLLEMLPQDLVQNIWVREMEKGSAMSPAKTKLIGKGSYKRSLRKTLHGVRAQQMKNLEEVRQRLQEAEMEGAHREQNFLAALKDYLAKWKPTAPSDAAAAPCAPLPH